MKSSGSASPSTWGPITIPKISSTTTTGGASRVGTTTTVTAARAPVRMTAKKEPSSTVIKLAPDYPCAGGADHARLQLPEGRRGRRA